MPVFFSTNPAEWYSVDGVYIATEPPPAVPDVDLSSATITKIVGDFPWGRTDTILTLSSSQDFKKLLGNAQSPEDYRGYRAIAGKQWGEIHAVRLSEGTQAKSSIDLHYEGEYTVGTYDTNDDYELTISGVPNAPITVGAQSGDHASEDDIYSHLETEINNHADLSEVVRAVADLAGDILYVVPDGDEDWSVSLNTPSNTGAHSFQSIVEQYTLTADHVGAVGDEIHVLHHQVSSSEFEIEEVWGSESARHGPFNFDGTSSTAQAINDELKWTEFVWDASFNSNSNPRSRTRGVNLSGGADANLTSGNSTPYEDALDVLASDEDGGQIIAAEPRLDETPNDALIQKGRTIAGNQRARFLHQAVASPYSLADNISKAGTYADDNLILTAHRVQQFIEGSEHTINLSAFVASVMAKLPPQFSPAAYRAREYLQPITDFEAGVNPSRANYQNAVDNGALVLQREKGGVWKLRSGVTTDTSPGFELITRSVLKDLVGTEIGQALLPFQNMPSTDQRVDQAKAAIQKVIGQLKGSEDVPTSRVIRDGTVNLVTHTSDTVQFQTRVELFGEMRYLIANLEIGAGIQIDVE